jgi:hypothetical protein
MTTRWGFSTPYRAGDSVYKVTVRTTCASLVDTLLRWEQILSARFLADHTDRFKKAPDMVSIVIPCEESPGTWDIRVSFEPATLERANSRTTLWAPTPDNGNAALQYTEVNHYAITPDDSELVPTISLWGMWTYNNTYGIGVKLTEVLVLSGSGASGNTGPTLHDGLGASVQARYNERCMGALECAEKCIG